MPIYPLLHSYTCTKFLISTDRVREKKYRSSFDGNCWPSQSYSSNYWKDSWRRNERVKLIREMLAPRPKGFGVAEECETRISRTIGGKVGRVIARRNENSRRRIPNFSHSIRFTTLSPRVGNLKICHQVCSFINLTGPSFAKQRSNELFFFLCWGKRRMEKKKEEKRGEGEKLFIERVIPCTNFRF